MLTMGMIDRGLFLLLFISISCSAEKADIHPQDITVSTASGLLVGSVKKTEKAVAEFKNIPYALPPTGDLRWKPPKEVMPWNGKREAKKFGPVCMQPQITEDDEFPFYYQHNLPSSEDCLSLNVWAPVPFNSKHNGKPYLRPVIVWIHGGGLLVGSSAMPMQNGRGLAEMNAVVVTFNYRLGVFGYYSHPELSKESVNKSSGNYGTLDQIEVLKWVKKNIAYFGGDPENVTLLGNSAGALSVTHLMSSPLATGLFDKAILQSNYLPVMSRLRENSRGNDTGEGKGLKWAISKGYRSINEMRTLSAVELLQIATGQGISGLSVEPEVVVDGWVFRDTIYNTFLNGRQADVPLIAGYNSGEALHFMSYPGWVPEYPENQLMYINRIKKIYGDIAEQYLSLYPGNNKRQSILNPIRDRFYGWPTEYFARQMSLVKSKAYFYYFDHALPKVKQLDLVGFHGSEVPFVSNNVRTILTTWPGLGEADQESIYLSDLMSEFWVNFAKTGRPYANNSPLWPSFSPDEKKYMLFKNGKASVSSKLNNGRELHYEIYKRRRNMGLPPAGIDIGLMSPSISVITSK
ncbi:carboxylesterase/lipase family protein [SAR92 clade bacterium H246]